MKQFSSRPLSLPTAIIGSCFALIHQQKEEWFELFIRSSVFNQLFVSKMAAALYLMENQALPNGKNVIPEVNTKEKPQKRRMKYDIYVFSRSLRLCSHASRWRPGRGSGVRQVTREVPARGLRDHVRRHKQHQEKLGLLHASCVHMETQMLVIYGFNSFAG